MATIEIYTGHDMGFCEECGAPIRKKTKRFQVVRGDEPEIDGPFCTQECAVKYRDRADEADAEEKLHDAAPDLLAACEAAVGCIDSGCPEVTEQLEAAIAKAKS